MQAYLVLEDGTIFKGFSFGASGETCGEVVFNTSMAGYQEIITDPSYRGQIVTMTYPLIGNYGINKEDAESRQPFLEGFVVKEYSKLASNWRKDQGLGEYLKENHVSGLHVSTFSEKAKHFFLKNGFQIAFGRSRTYFRFRLHEDICAYIMTKTI